ncbi:MAG TPA: ribosomal protein S18-alanine N-acetyltransferase [Xanthomonadales bacterium]|nr:ribosomal protein S18-alanine N-acetyltransferase [Xanthomonadales bacterium]
MSANPRPFDPEIRVLTLNDLDRIIKIEHSAYPFPWSRGIFVDCMRVGYDCWGLQVRDLLVAYAIQTHAAGESHLLNLCVDPEWQRAGYGSILLEHAICQAAVKRCTSMFLEVRPSNPAAIRLYKTRGFVVVGERRNYYRAEKGRETAIVMRLELDQQIAAP